MLFLWHTLKMEERTTAANAAAAMAITVANNHDKVDDVRENKASGTMRRNSSYSSFIFDPRTHFKESGKCQFSDHPDLAKSDPNIAA